MKAKSKREFSKVLLSWTRITFVASVSIACLFAWAEKDTTVFCYIIPSAAGTYGAAIVFYLNKAKTENIFKGKMRFLQYKLKMLQKTPPELHKEIENEIQPIDDALNSAIDGTMNNAVSEEINITNY